MKRITAILLALAMITTVSCSKKSGSQASKPAAQTADFIQTNYKLTDIEFDDDIMEALAMKHIGDKCRFFYLDQDKMLKFTDIDNELNTSEPVELMKINLSSVAINVNIDGCFELVVSETDFPFEYDSLGNIANYQDYIDMAVLYYKLIRFDNQGNVINETYITGLDEYFDLESSVLCELVPYGSDRFILSILNGFVLIDSDGNVVDGNTDPEIMHTYMGLDSEGNVIYTNHQGFAYMDGSSLDLPNIEKQLDVPVMIGAAVPGSGSYKAYLPSVKGIHGLDENNELTLLLDYDKSLIEYIRCFDEFGDGRFIGYSYDEAGLVSYTRRPDDYIENKQIIEVWKIGSYSDEMDSNTFSFCKHSDDYTVKIVAGKTFDDLTNAILTNEGPDIITGCQNYTDSLVNMGALADLNSLLDGKGGLKREELMPNVLEALEYKGGIYGIPDEFSISMCVANRDFIGDEYIDWSIDDFISIYENRPDGMKLGYEMSPFFLLCTYNLNTWIDFRNNTCRFDSDDFLKVLEICKSEGELYNRDVWGDKAAESVYIPELITSLRDKKAMIAHIDCSKISFTIYDIGTYGISLSEASMLHYPGSSGCGAINIVGSMYSIAANSDCIDGAWEYISYMLSEESMKRSGCGGNLINKKVFEYQLDSVRQNGDEPEYVESTFNNIPYKYVCTATDEDIQRYRNFVLNCNSMMHYDSEITGIITEEYDRFMNDEITAKECAYNTQSRVEILLAETA